MMRTGQIGAGEITFGEYDLIGIQVMQIGAGEIATREPPPDPPLTGHMRIREVLVADVLTFRCGHPHIL